MAKTILCLHGILFEQIERLNDKNLKGEELENEIKKADAINKIASQIVSAGRLVMEAARLEEDFDLPDEYKTTSKGKESKKLVAPGERRPLINRLT
jgi:hypothetical protein